MPRPRLRPSPGSPRSAVTSKARSSPGRSPNTNSSLQLWKIWRFPKILVLGMGHFTDLALGQGWEISQLNTTQLLGISSLPTNIYKYLKVLFKIPRKVHYQIYSSSLPIFQNPQKGSKRYIYQPLLQLLGKDSKVLGRDRRHDGWWRERCAGVEAGGHRHCHGHCRHRGGQGREFSVASWGEIGILWSDASVNGTCHESD